MSLVKLRKLIDRFPMRIESFVLMSRSTAEEFGIDTSKLQTVVPDQCGQCYFCDVTQYPDGRATSRCDHPTGEGSTVDRDEAPPPQCPFRSEK